MHKHVLFPGLFQGRLLGYYKSCSVFVAPTLLDSERFSSQIQLRRENLHFIFSIIHILKVCNPLRNGLFFQCQVEEVERGERMELEIIFDIALEFFPVFNNESLRPF